MNKRPHSTVVTRDMPKRSYREGRWLTVARAVPARGQNVLEAAQELSHVLPFGSPEVYGPTVVFRRPVDHYKHMGKVKNVERRHGVIFNKRFGASQLFGVQESATPPMTFVKNGVRYEFKTRPGDTEAGIERIELLRSVDGGPFESVGYYTSRYMARRAVSKIIGEEATMNGEAGLERTSVHQTRPDELASVHESLALCVTALSSGGGKGAARGRLRSSIARMRGDDRLAGGVRFAEQALVQVRAGDLEQARTWATRARQEVGRVMGTGRTFGHTPEACQGDERRYRSGYEVYDEQGNYRTWLDNLEQAIACAKGVGPGSRVSEAKGSRRTLHTVEDRAGESVTAKPESGDGINKSRGHLFFHGGYEWFLSPRENVYRAAKTHIISARTGYREGGREVMPLRLLYPDLLKGYGIPERVWSKTITFKESVNASLVPSVVESVPNTSDPTVTRAIFALDPLSKAIAYRYGDWDRAKSLVGDIPEKLLRTGAKHLLYSLKRAIDRQQQRAAKRHLDALTRYIGDVIEGRDTFANEFMR